MYFTPRYAQPFTLLEANALDIPIIVKEIDRLRDSIRRLKETQQILKEAIESVPPGSFDADLTTAFQENEIVIDSQKERITILELALNSKGIPTGETYQTTQLEELSTIDAEQNSASGPAEERPRSGGEDGIYL